MSQENWKKYQSMKTYRIDGERFSTLEGFYEEISRVLIPNTRWGQNLDAFNDILRGGYGTPDEGFFSDLGKLSSVEEALGAPRNR